MVNRSDKVFEVFLSQGLGLKVAFLLASDHLDELIFFGGRLSQQIEDLSVILGKGANRVGDQLEGLLRLVRIVLNSYRQITIDSVNLLHQETVLLGDEILQCLHKSNELVVLGFNSFFVDLEYEHLELSQSTQELLKHVMLSVKISPVLVTEHLLVSNDIVIYLRDDCNQEVEKNDKVDELVHKPHHPNQEYHEVLGGKLASHVVAQRLVPVGIARH